MAATFLVPVFYFVDKKLQEMSPVALKGEMALFPATNPNAQSLIPFFQLSYQEFSQCCKHFFQIAADSYSSHFIERFI